MLQVRLSIWCLFYNIVYLIDKALWKIAFEVKLKNVVIDRWNEIDLSFYFYLIVNQIVVNYVAHFL